MENNSRRNSEVQSVMYELSHGSDSYKKSKTDLILFAILVPLGVFLPFKYIQVLGAATCIIWFIRNWKFEKKVNRAKIEAAQKESKIHETSFNRRAKLLYNISQEQTKRTDVNNIIFKISQG